ncbi:MAG: hypothetical protein GQ569_07565, partial [Methylococcaceae bacterium]|nr:hypothetical protein [Methylococcaceae bacterium]
MKIVFYLALLTNIVYFSWQYQQGALDKILSNSVELVQNTEKQILLLTEAEQAAANSIENKLEMTVHSKPSSENATTKVPTTATIENNAALIATINKTVEKQCYQVGVFSNDTSIDKWAEKIGIDSALLQKHQKNKTVITGYLVFYPKETTFNESKKNLKMLKELGVKGAWLFQKGEFKGDISLGIFKTEAKAMQLQKEFFAKSIFAEVKPRYKVPPQIYVKLQTDKTAQQLKVVLKGLVKKASVQALAKCY